MAFQDERPGGQGKGWGSQSDRLFKYVTGMSLSVIQFVGLRRLEKIVDVVVLSSLTVSFL